MLRLLSLSCETSVECRSVVLSFDAWGKPVDGGGTCRDGGGALKNPSEMQKGRKDSK